MVLPVKLLVGEATQLAHTVDITCGGTRLGGLRAALQPGETVILQRNHRGEATVVAGFDVFENVDAVGVLPGSKHVSVTS
jgi:hypothetical protein